MAARARARTMGSMPLVVTEARPGSGAAETARYVRGLLDPPDLRIVVVDALRPWLPSCADEADVVVVTRVDIASRDAVDRVVAAAADDAPFARVVLAASPVELEPGPPL